MLRDIESSPAESLPAAISVLQRRRLVAAADSSALDAWSSRLEASLRAPTPEARCTAASLLAETVRQCTEQAFGRHRDTWTNALFHLLQPVNDGTTTAAAIAAANSVRLAAAEALVEMAMAAAGWPTERREMSGSVTRLASILLGMLSSPATQAGAVCLLGRLCQAAPHSLRAHRDKLGEELPRLLLEADAETAHDAAALLGALPSCLPAAAIKDAWMITAQRLAGTLQHVLRCGCTPAHLHGLHTCTACTPARPARLHACTFGV